MKKTEQRDDRRHDDRQTANSVTAHRSCLVSPLWNVPLGWQLSTLYTLLLVVTLSAGGLAGLHAARELSGAGRGEAAGASGRAHRGRYRRRLPQRVPADGRRATQGRMAPDARSGQGNSGGPKAETAQHQLMENLVRGLSGPDVTVAVLDTARAT